MTEWLWFFLACGFVLGVLCTLIGVVAFWSYETHRYRRRYARPRSDEHATWFLRQRD